MISDIPNATEEVRCLAAKKRRIQEYAEAAEHYFAVCDEANSQCEPKMPLAKPYTLSGLLCCLGISRKAFFALEGTRDGRVFVNHVLTKIEAFIEENALSGRLSASAAQSSLKYSFGWGDKERDGEDEKITVTLTPEARRLAE